jgi:hypothetical protein
MMKKPFTLLLFLAIALASYAQSRTTTYCNPLNLDYSYPFHNAHLGKSYRSGADPAVVQFRGEFYMFVTRSYGYWHSTDLTHWHFITPERWYFEGSNAPAAFNYKDSVLYVTGNPSGAMSLLYTNNPEKGDWKPVTSVLYDLQDPAFFIDDDGKSYMFWGSSNKFPLRVKELLTRRHFMPATGETIDLFNLDPAQHGWERFGENHTDTLINPFIEGAWMTKRNGRYYLEYAAPGTQFNVYADGYYVSDNPVGDYRYAPNNPYCYKPGGFINGAGHGSTVIGQGAQYWHFATMAISVNYQFERRLCMFPAFFDDDGLMYANTAFGDYPHFAPDQPGKRGEFTGWMLLSYKKPIEASSQLPDAPAGNANDENAKTCWVAAENNDKQWLSIDLLAPSKVYAVQVNYFDYNETDIFGRQPDFFHRYRIEGSTDGNTWTALVDKSRSFRDTPNDYIELDAPATARYIRFVNIHAPTRHLAISGLRIFGKGNGTPPAAVRNFSVQRHEDRRDATLTWEKQKNAQGYNIHWGIAPGKLYNSWLVYDENTLNLRCLTTGQKYYFGIEAFNENGVSSIGKIIEVQ